MDKISVSQSLSQEEFVRFSFLRYFRRPVILIIYSLFILFAAFMAYVEFQGSDPDLSFIFPFLGILILLPLVVFYSARSVFKTSHAIREPVTYEFSDEWVSAKAEKYDFRQSWDLIYKVEETKNWFLIFTNRINAIYLKKESFEDEADMEVLKSLIRGKSHILQKLKK